MDDYDFRKIDLRVLSRLNPQVTNQKPPNKTELVSIGEWNEIVIPGVNIIVDSGCIVWIELPNPESDCEVTIS